MRRQQSFGARSLAMLGAICLGLVSVSAAVHGQDTGEITHSSFEDFSKGTLDASGSNIYISRSGYIEMINRMDFNQDGYLDLFFLQDHNVTENEDVFVYWGTKEGPESILPSFPERRPQGQLVREIHDRRHNVTRLPSEGGGRTLLVDLNNDGNKEIVFSNFMHNYGVYTEAYIYWAQEDGYGTRRRTILPTLLAAGVAAADFNQDGYVDLVFANHGTEGGDRFGYEEHLESYIYWNSPTGFSEENRTSVPSISASDCVAGDLNGDGYPELIISNNMPEEKSVYLYWGGEAGFSKDRREIYPEVDANGLKLANLTGDDTPELVLLLGDDRAEVWQGSSTGFDTEPWVELPTQGATECEIADLDKNGHKDLVFPNHAGETSYMYWGESDGYAPDRRTELPALHATGAALADFNGNGWTDVAFANEHDGETYDVDSYLYWNGPDGFHAAHRKHLRGFGPTAVEAADLDHDGHADLVLVNRYSGAKGDIDSMIYWGNPAHHYSEAAVRFLRGGHTAPAVFADLDQDGWTDMSTGTGRFYWGGEDGLTTDEDRNFTIEGSRGNQVADLNGDGYLDLVVAKGTAYGDVEPGGLILWGSEDGYELENSAEFPLICRYPGVGPIADLDKDGYLDLVFTDIDDDSVEIFWGNADAEYSKEHYTLLEIQPGLCAEIADLNADGWLDLIIGGGWDPRRHGRPMKYSSIVWGGPEGFSSERVQRLESFDSIEQAVADLNKDGYLDLVMGNYHAYSTRTIPAFIYWGGPDGYDESRRSSLPAESSSAVMVADYNKDSWMDIVVSNHIEIGDHSVGSNIFWGGPEGYSYQNRDTVQTFGVHLAVIRDVGNIYDRALDEHFISSPIQATQGQRFDGLDWQARTPHGTVVKFQIRSATSEAGLDSASWRGPEGADSFYTEPGSDLDVPGNHGWLQYKAVLTTPYGGNSPILEEVTVPLSSN